MVRRVVRGQLVLPDGVLDDGMMEIEGNRIVAVRPAAQARDEGVNDDWREHWITPGFIDIHTHGIGGRDCMDEECDSLPEIARRLLAHGVTGFLATTVTQSVAATAAAIERARAFMALQADALRSGALPQGARLLGLHLEGPFIAPTARGAQNPDYILPPDVSVLTRLLDAAQGCVRIVTLAPELAGARDLIDALTAAGVRVSMGHTTASCEQAQTAIAAGVKHVTHCYNAMTGLHHRAPGVVGAALTTPGVMSELIADTVHVHPVAMRVVITMKPRDDVALISDSIAAADMPDGTYELGGLLVTTKDGVARLAGGELAGSTLTLERAVGNLVRLGLASLCDAVYMASASPAHALGLDERKGRLAVGCDADYAVWDRQGALVEVALGGRTVFGSTRT